MLREEKESMRVKATAEKVVSQPRQARRMYQASTRFLASRRVLS